MLMDIIMESLASMDDETLNSVLESCSEEELEIINSAMEETAPLTSAEHEKISKITNIQAAAREKGWANVPADERKYYVNTIVKASNDKDFLKRLKKAKQLGEKEGATNSKLNKALSIFTKADAAVNAVAGGVQGATSMNILSAGDPGITLGGGIGGAVAGGGYGALHGAVISKIIKEADKIRRYERDKHELYSQGDDIHPEDAWKSKRRKEIEAKLRDTGSATKTKLSDVGNSVKAKLREALK